MVCQMVINAKGRYKPWKVGEYEYAAWTMWAGRCPEEENIWMKTWRNQNSSLHLSIRMNRRMVSSDRLTLPTCHYSNLNSREKKSAWLAQPGSPSIINVPSSARLLTVMPHLCPKPFLLCYNEIYCKQTMVLNR